jgi:hypothetical protein
MEEHTVHVHATVSVCTAAGRFSVDRFILVRMIVIVDRRGLAIGLKAHLGMIMIMSIVLLMIMCMC